jgi:nucleoside-diphosphate-sugar epimerase
VRIAVTGASGFLGGFVCAELLGRGHEVASLVRREGSEPAGTEAVIADLTDAESLSRGVAGAAPECVIHLAAEIASQRDPEKIRDANVEGTRRLIAACEAAGVRRIVFTSTVVTGDANGELLEEAKPLPVETEYGRSKQEGERLLHESSLEDVVIRPSHVYGPGGWFVEEFVNRLRQPGRFAVIGSGENWWDVVRVEDVAAACADAAERAAPGALYHVVDDEPIRFYDFVALVAESLGTGRPRRVPAWLARIAAGADPVRAATRSAKSSNARIKAELGWAPRFPNARMGVPDAVAKIDAAAV